MNRFLFILCLLLSFAGGDSVIQAADPWNYPTSKPSNPFGGGDGSQWNPYRIDNAQHLANLAYMVTDDNTEYHGKYFVLTNDITLNDNVINEEGTGLANAEGDYKLWTPIGEYGITADDDFRGFFDGQGHTISGLVCISEDGKRDYLALFGTTDDATIKNLNMKDSYVCTKATDSDAQSFGMLIGKSMNTTVINCHVANSVVNVTHTYTVAVLERNCSVGGLIGCCDFVAGYSFADHKTIMTNCSFSGKIYTTLDGENNALYVGGLFGYQTDRADGSVDLTNCNTEGDIYINVLQNVYEICGGGIAACICKWKDSDLKRCVSRMNITVESGNNTIKECYLSGFCSVDSKTNYNYLQRVSQCASLGTIKVGTAANKAKITNLYLGGFSYWYGYLSSCAFYGKFDVHSEGREIRITPLAKFLCKFDNTPSVVCSVGNVIDINYSKTPNLDQVSTYTYRQETEGYNHFRVDTHNYYYRFENTSGVTVPCNGTANASKYNKTLEQMNTADFIKTLNQDAGSNVWGKMTGTNSDLDGLPMPIACGGTPIEYTGDGTSESTAYIINTEADLNKLKEYVNNGTTFDGKYFKLGSDINMTEIMDNSIGFYKEKPFKGHLDGNGHAIVGLRNTLFGYIYGTVKNLALVDCNIKGNGYVGAIAGFVGDENKKAEVSNCYVSGVVQSSMSGISAQIRLGGICGYVYNGSAVHDCYFKGHLIAKNPYGSVSSATHFVGGISGYNGNGMVDTNKPQGIYNCYASFEYHKDLSSFTNFYAYGIGNNYVQDCYAITSSEINNTTGCTKLNSESELNGKFDGKAGWLQGVYRPVLASAKNYAATTPEATPKTVYFDAIPEANPKPNYFYNISIEDPYSDVSLWNLPNMAVYVPSEQKDYITNGYLDQSANFQYKRSANATATAGQLRYDLTQNASGYHMLCLPGVVERGDLPEGSKVMIVGKIQKVGEKEQVNVVMVDTIPAGVPCMLYVPTSSVAKDEKIPLVMRSGIVSEPIMNKAYSDFKGTFSKKNDLTVWTCTTVKIDDKNKQPYFDRNTTPVTVLPFTAWLANANLVVQIVDYVLLDEENEAMTVALYGMNDKTYNLKMRRTIKASKWNTVCLPFDMTAEEIATTFGEDTKVETFNSLKYDTSTETTTLEFREATAETEGGAVIKAGTPYLLKPSKPTDVSIFEIKNRKIKCESVDYVPAGTKMDATTTAGTVSLTMQGEYNHRMISPNEATDVKSLYVISGNKIYYVNSEVEMKGFRCYFVAEETVSGSGAKLFSNAKVMHSDGTSTDLRLIKAEPTGDADAVYDLLGRKSNGQRNGVVIKNGKKRIVK